MSDNENEAKRIKETETFKLYNFYTENKFDITKFDLEYKIGGDKTAEEFYDGINKLEYGLYYKHIRLIINAIDSIKSSKNHENVIYLKKLIIEYFNSLVFDNGKI